MSSSEEKVSALAKTIKAILETGNSERDVIDKFAAALHQLGFTKEAELIFAAASALWGQPSEIDQIAAWFEAQAVKERELLDSGYCNSPVTTHERWLVYKASAQSVRASAWKNLGTVHAGAAAGRAHRSPSALTQEVIDHLQRSRKKVTPRATTNMSSRRSGPRSTRRPSAAPNARSKRGSSPSANA